MTKKKTPPPLKFAFLARAIEANAGLNGFIGAKRVIDLAHCWFLGELPEAAVLSAEQRKQKLLVVAKQKASKEMVRVEAETKAFDADVETSEMAQFAASLKRAAHRQDPREVFGQPEAKTG